MRRSHWLLHFGLALAVVLGLVCTSAQSAEAGVGEGALPLGSALSGPAVAAETPLALAQVQTRSVSLRVDNPTCYEFPLEPFSTLCTQWTGGWPGGQVWAWGSGYYYRVRLQRCVADSCPAGLWSTAATSAPNTTVTARVPVSKT